jgi:enoyl-CoA hydratase
VNNSLNYELDGEVAVITLDDGKANACGFAMLDAINAALDRAQAEARAVLLLGRPGVLSGGFDLKVIKGGDANELDRLLKLGVRTLMRLYGHPQPLVTAATGHALALGALILLASDYRFGVAGEFKIGLNETAIGLSLPAFGVELAEARLSRRHLTQATLLARLYGPAQALDVGFLDEVLASDALRSTAIAKARELAALDATAFAATKHGFRAAAIDRVLAALKD